MSDGFDKFNSDDVLEYTSKDAARVESVEYRKMGWKGLGEGVTDVDADSDVASPAISMAAGSEEGLDMTPMVDVTFLLLIFFMVTASFVLQKSIEHPQALDDSPSPDPLRPAVVEVFIDQNNVYYVSSSDIEIECPSEREMRAQLKGLRKESDADRMIIRAHVDSKHNRVVSAWDAGRVAGLEEILFKTEEEL